MDSYTKEFENFQLKTKILNSSNVSLSELGFSSTGLYIHNDSINNYLDRINFKFGAYFNENSVKKLIDQGKKPRLTFIGYLTPKFFTSNSTLETENPEKVKCTPNRQLIPNIVSASQIQGVEKTDDLITIIYEEQKVLKLFYFNKKKFFSKKIFFLRMKNFVIQKK